MIRRLLLTLFCGCAAQPSAPAFDRNAMLSSVTSQIILVNYADLTAKVQTLADGIRTDSAAVAQAKWDAAYQAFKRTETHGFGPATEQFLADAIASWPTAATGTLDADALTVSSADQVSALGTSRKGLAVVEYVLWDSRFEQRRAYAGAIADGVLASAKALEAAWTNGYGQAFENGRDPFRSVKNSIDTAYNRLISTAESVAGMRLGDPLGAKTGGTPQPDAVESRFSEHSAAHALATVNGMELFYTGQDGEGMGAIVKARDAALNDRVLDAFAAAKAALMKLRSPLLSSGAADITAAATAVRDIRNILNTEVANAIGVTVTYSDNDGD